MEHHIPQDEIRRIIINDMVKKRNSIVPVIGEDTYYFSVLMVLLWLSYGILKWMSRAFEDSSKAMRRYALFTDMSVCQRNSLGSSIHLCSGDDEQM